MIRKMFAVGARAALLIVTIGLVGCSPIKNANVEIDSSKTVHKPTPAEVQQIQNNPHIPPAIKAQMLGNSGGPPMGHTGGQGH